MCIASFCFNDTATTEIYPLSLHDALPIYIKSVALLPNILGMQQAREAGAYEAWMVNDEGMVTEGTLSNAWIITEDGKLVTHNASHAILNGITRLTVLEAAAEAGVEFSERPFSVDEALQAKEEIGRASCRGRV